MNRLLILLIAGATAPALLDAQEVEVVERVVAVVGDSVVLQTDLDEQILNLAASGQQIPQDPEALARLRREVLEAQISELLLIQAALRDSVSLSFQEVSQAVDREIAARTQAFGSERALLQALQQRGMTLQDYRNELEQQYRRLTLVRNFLQTKQRDRRPPPVTEAEMRAYFESQRAQLGQRPATITFRQVVVPARPSEAAREAARRRAEEVLALLRGGEEFEQLARRFSQDQSTRERGGDLGWFRRGQMVNAFEDAAYALPQGQHSGIVESNYGFHIIRVDRIRGPERQARHILIQPELTADDLARSRALADSVATLARAGASLPDLSDRFGDPTEDQRVGPFPMDRLPEPYRTQLAIAQTGAVVGPFELTTAAPNQPAKWSVVKVTEVTPAGEYTFADPQVREQVRLQLESERGVEEIVGELRRRTYVDIRL